MLMSANTHYQHAENKIKDDKGLDYLQLGMTKILPIMLNLMFNVCIVRKRRHSPPMTTMASLV